MISNHYCLAETIRHQASIHSNLRYVVAVAGIPGSGKTTVSSAVINYLKTDLNLKAVLLPMDGFHLSRLELDQLPNAEEAHARRGAPWTYDVQRFVRFMYRLRSWADNMPLAKYGKWKPEDVLYAPTFDHEAKDPVDDGIFITPDTSIIVVEGNYLLFDQPEWRDIAGLIDYRVFVDTNILEARDRAARRHVKTGVTEPLEDGYRRVDSNDYLNGLAIRET
jgi:Panthothenate kinase